MSDGLAVIDATVGPIGPFEGPADYIGRPIHDEAGRLVGYITSAKRFDDERGGVSLLCTLGGLPSLSVGRFNAAFEAASQTLAKWEMTCRRYRPAPKLSPVVGPSVRCGRNHCCPCGSGAKFKRCCRAKAK